MLIGAAHEYYYDSLVGQGLNFVEICTRMKEHFETEERRYEMMNEWHNLSPITIIKNNPEKSNLECYEILVTEMQRIRRGLDIEHRTDKAMKTRLQLACRDVEACSSATMKPAATFEGLCSDTRLAISTKSRISNQLAHTFLVDRNFYDESNSRNNIGNNIEHLRGPFNDQNRIDNILFTDRRYHTRNNGFEQRYSRNPVNENFKKEGCWSMRHSQYERSKAYDMFKLRLKRHNKSISDEFVRQYVVEFEGILDEQNVENDELDEYDQLILECTLSENDTDKLIETNSGINSTTYLTSFGNIDGSTAVTLLNDQSVHHAITKISSFDDDDTKYTYVSSKRYSSDEFQGIVLDTGAAEWSTAGYGEYKALKEVKSQIHLDESRAGEASVQFVEGLVKKSIGTVNFYTPIGMITFHVLRSATPFVLSLRDMDRIGIEFHNLRNVLVQGNIEVSIIRKFGHPFLLPHEFEKSLVQSYITDSKISSCHLTEIELRQIHRRFGHPSARRLTRILERSGHDFDKKLVAHLTKYCHLCQMHGKFPGRFKFTSREDCEFNHIVNVDVMFIDGDPLLHVVDEATRFQAAR
ncbi:hypothetical protein K3495_g12696 [Podosphaera aphanis]|nr:hypothetical protein K3495_g12696 [Podosphaera aphanis]